MRIKLNKNVAKKRQQKLEVVEVSYDRDDLVDRFNAVFAELGQVVVGRSDALEALKYCVISREHMLMEGLHGVAKSLLVTAFSKRVTGSRFFKKLLMKSTQADELFGPMSAKKYRDNEIWHHNTEKMLPEADFAFLDEVYRGSDAILPTMLNILNEREFINGNTVQRCPLITAIGACNIVPDTEDLQAFQDRWLVHMKIEPLDSPNKRIKALQLFLDGQDSKPERTIDIQELKELIRIVRHAEISEECERLYEDLVCRYRAQTGNQYVSDRRFCHAIRLAQAASVLDGNLGPVKPEHLYSVRLALAKPGHDESLFTQAFNASVGGFEQAKQELASLEEFADMLRKVKAKFSVSLNVPKLEKISETCRSFLEYAANMPPDKAPKTNEGKEKLDEIVRGFNTLINECASALSAST